MTGPDDIASREEPLAVTERHAGDVAAAERVGALDDADQDRVQVVVLGEVTGHVGQRLRLGAAPLGVGVEPRALDRHRRVAPEGGQHLQHAGADVLGPARHQREHADQPAMRDERDRRAGGETLGGKVLAIDRAWITLDVGDQHRPALQRGMADDALADGELGATRRGRVVPGAGPGARHQPLVLEDPQRRSRSLYEAGGRPHHAVQHLVEVRRGGDALDELKEQVDPGIEVRRVGHVCLPLPTGESRDPSGPFHPRTVKPLGRGGRVGRAPADPSLD